MADTKISAMTPALEVKNLDVLPIVSAGANFKATRVQLLTGAVGEPLAVIGAAGQFVQLSDSTSFNFFGVDNVGDCFAQTVNVMTVSSSGVMGTTAITLDGTNGIANWLAPFAIFITYIPAVPANWLAPPPVDLAAAIDRCAAAIVARTVGGPI